MRWRLESRHPFAIGGPWIGELAFQLLQPGTADQAAAQQTLRTARLRVRKFVRTGKLSDRLIEAALQVAKLDPVYRGALISESLDFQVSPGDITDLRNLLNVLPTDRFKPKRHCLLNPKLRMAHLVGGADVDLVLDNLILDAKTTKDPKCWRDYFNQMIGYYLLYLLGGFSVPGRQPRIDSLGIYFARQGQLQVWSIRDIADTEAFERSAAWFKRRAQSGFLAGRDVPVLGLDHQAE